MFGPSYFGRRYFGARYWGSVAIIISAGVFLVGDDGPNFGWMEA